MPIIHIPPDLTGEWLVATQPNEPPWKLQSKGGRWHLTGSWRGPCPDQQLATFTTRANENRTEYTGTFEVSEEGVHGSGTISFRGISEDALTVTMHESGHAPRTFELVRSHGSSEPAITLLANGKTSDSVQAGAWVALGAMQTGSIPCPDRPARITIAGSGSNGASTEARYSAPSCVQPVTNGASTWSYLATLHGNSGNVLAKSPTVTVTWSTPATG